VIDPVNDQLRGSFPLLAAVVGAAWLCLFLFVFIVIAPAFLLVLSALNGDSWAENGDRVQPVFWLLLAAGTVLLLRRAVMRGVVISKQGILLRSLLGQSRFIPWSDVTAIDIHAVKRDNGMSDVYSVRVQVRGGDGPVTLPARWCGQSPR
jgi:Bacterial PH domain